MGRKTVVGTFKETNRISGEMTLTKLRRENSKRNWITMNRKTEQLYKNKLLEWLVGKKLYLKIPI